LGVEMTRPAGSVSVKPTPVSVVVVLLFWMVKLSEVEPFSGMLAAPKDLMSTAGETTVTLAFDVFPFPPSVEVTVTLLFFTPAIVPCTLSDTVQEAPGARVTADKLTEEEPAAAVAVPPQVLVRPFGVATTKPVGRLSVKPIPVSEITFAAGLVILKVSEVVPSKGMLAAPNTLVMVGGVATVRFAEAVLPVPPLVDVTLAVVLVNWPDAAPVTVTLNWHWLFTAIVAPVSEIVPGAVVVSVPPQTVAEAFATVRPVGNVSVNASPDSGSTLAAGFVMVKVSEVVAFNAMLVGLKTFAMVGGASTLIEAEAVPPVLPSVDVTLLVVLFWSPAEMPVTFTDKVQDALAAIVPPERLMVLVPAVAVIVPPQVLV
jgi:hypothetical protein